MFRTELDSAYFAIAIGVAQGHRVEIARYINGATVAEGKGPVEGRMVDRTPARNRAGKVKGK